MPCRGTKYKPLSIGGEYIVVKDLVPRIHFYDQDFVDMYDRVWIWLDDLWHPGDKDGAFPEGYYTYGDSNVISLFDTCLSCLFLAYSNQRYSADSMIDFFYSVQGPDGQIAEKYDVASRQPVFDDDNPKGATLPLLSYVEFTFYHKIGNKKRLKEALPHLESYFSWVQSNFLQPNGLYSVPYAATHMGDLPREGAVYTVDYNAMIAVFALYMSYIGEILNDKELSFRYMRTYFSVKTRINSMMWDNEDGFYYDLDGDGKIIKNKHIGAYWTLLAKIPNEDYSLRLIDKLKDDKEFGTENPFPSVPVSSKYFNENGDGYRCGVVPFFTYLVVKGLMNYEAFVFARECSIRHMYFILDTLNPDEERQGDVWEIYKPGSEGPAAAAGGNKKRYLPMIGLVAVTLVIENIIGLEISLPRKTVLWTMQSLEEMGIEGLSLKKNNITILSNKNVRGWEIRLESEKLYYFTIQVLEEEKKKTLPIPSGKCSMFIDKL